MRWNPSKPGEHQYATAYNWASAQVSRIKKIYDELHIDKLELEVPRYSDQGKWIIPGYPDTTVTRTGNPTKPVEKPAPAPAPAKVQSNNDNYNEKYAAAVEKFAGKVYLSGANGPDKFDCSGAVVAGIRSITSKFGDYTADQLFKKFSTDHGGKVRGSLIFYDYKGDGKIDHVTTILNESEMLHPSSGALKLQIKPINYLDKYTKDQGGKIYYRQINWDLIIGN